MLTTREAADLSGWSQDQINRLCRKGILASVRTKALWLVDADALVEYSNAMRERSISHLSPNDSVMIGDRSMISTRAAAKIANCTQDYITLLARHGKITAAQHSGHWFIEEGSLRTFLLDSARRKQELRERIRQERSVIRRLHEELAATGPRRTE